MYYLSARGHLYIAIQSIHCLRSSAEKQTTGNLVISSNFSSFDNAPPPLFSSHACSVDTNGPMKNIYLNNVFENYVSIISNFILFHFYFI